MDGALYYLMGYVFMFAMPIITIIYGIVGLAKDNKIPMAIIGLNLGIAYLVIMLVRYFVIFSYSSPYY